MIRQIPWLRVFVEGVVIVDKLARERGGELVKLAEELDTDTRM